jgi:peptidoglycan/LPS O-acetylase OafA/YrhL
MINMKMKDTGFPPTHAGMTVGSSLGCIGFIAALTVGWLSFHFIEFPLNSKLRRAFSKKTAPAIVQSGLES